MARKQRGSANWAKAKAKVARAHAKVRDARRDFLHKTTTRLVRDHDVIAIEDLNVRGMVRNRSLAKAISDCGWGEFRFEEGRPPLGWCGLLQGRAARSSAPLPLVERWRGLGGAGHRSTVRVPVAGPSRGLAAALRGGLGPATSPAQ